MDFKEIICKLSVFFKKAAGPSSPEPGQQRHIRDLETM